MFKEKSIAIAAGGDRKGAQLANRIIALEETREEYGRFRWLFESIQAGPTAKLDAEGDARAFARFVRLPYQGLLTDEKPPRGALRKLLREIAPAVNAFLRDGRAWEVNLGKASRRLEWSGFSSAAKRTFATFKTDWRSAFLLRAMDLTAQGARMLRPCKATDCGKLFPGRKRQEFCSPRCKQREGQRQFRAGKTDEAWREYRHGIYKRYMAKLRGEAVAKHVQQRTSEQGRGKSR